MDMERTFLWLYHKFVHLDIEDIFFGLDPNNLVLSIERIQAQCRKAYCLDIRIFFYLCYKHKFSGTFCICWHQSPRNQDNRTICIFHFTRKDFTMDKHMLI